MKSNLFSFVLPLRAGSQRIPNKNTKDFASVAGGLTSIKLAQLLKVSGFNCCYVTSDDPVVLDIASGFKDSRIVIDERPHHLCSSSTRIEDLIQYIRNLVDDEHIFWVHATAPFVDERILMDAWKQYTKRVIIDQVCDSMMSVTKIQQFLWDKTTNAVTNNKSLTTRWPQTQDLVPLYEINHAFYINAKEKYEDRIGMNPYCYELNKLQSIDIDWPDDFELAELIYKSKLY